VDSGETTDHAQDMPDVVTRGRKYLEGARTESDEHSRTASP
jgi:hypothetical protein